MTLVLITGLVTSVFLVRQRQLSQTQAKYTELQSLPVNVTATSMGVWWRSDKPGAGCATLTEVDSRQTFKACDQDQSQVHLLNISGLTAQSRYEIQVTLAGETVWLSPFFGSYTQTSPGIDAPTPQFVSGKVVTNRGKPLVNATVFVALDLSDQFRFPLAVKTNQKGEFDVDLSKFIYSLPRSFNSYFVEVADSVGKKLVETTISTAEVNSGEINITIE